MRIIYCTIASANYLPRVMVWVESLRRYKRDPEIRVLLCEDPLRVRELSGELGMKFDSVDEIGCVDWLRMAFIYDVTEFNTAVKPFFLQALFAAGADGVIFFDPDVQFFHDPSEIEEKLENHECVLTPHNLKPLPEDGRVPSQLQINRVGQFNLGFVALRRSADVDSFLVWWGERLLRDCVSDLSRGIFVDQSWANLLVSFLPRCAILRSQGYNFAYWNACQRELRRDDGSWQTSDGPLVFFHYSGLTANDLESVSRHQNRIRAPVGSALRELLEEYVETLVMSPFARFASTPYSFDRFTDGTDISMVLRRFYRELPECDAGRIANPFSAREELEAMVATGPVSEESRLEQLHAELAVVRSNLGQAEKELGELNARMGRLRHRIVDVAGSVMEMTGTLSPTRTMIMQSRRFAQRIGAAFRAGS